MDHIWIVQGAVVGLEPSEQQWLPCWSTSCPAVAINEQRDAVSSSVLISSASSQLGCVLSLALGLLGQGSMRYINVPICQRLSLCIIGRPCSRKRKLSSSLLLQLRSRSRATKWRNWRYQALCRSPIIEHRIENYL